MKVPIRLESHPELRRCLQQTSKTQSRVGRDAALSEHNFVQAVQRDPKPPRGFDLANGHRLQKLLEQHLTWRIPGPSQLGSLVIVFDADFVGMSLLPSERDAILVVDPKTVPSCLIALQRLESIAGRDRRSSSRAATSSAFSFRCATRQISRGIRLAERVLRSRNRSAVVSLPKTESKLAVHATRIVCSRQSALSSVDAETGNLVNRQDRQFLGG